MATTMTLGELMIAVRQRADMLPNGYSPTTNGTDYFVTDTELVSYINQSYFELYDLMISSYGANYFVKQPPYSFTTDGTSSQFALPSDFYKLLGVDLQLSANAFCNIMPFEFVERNRFTAPNLQSFLGRTNLRYRLNGDNLWLTPIPAGGQVIQVWYVPRLQTLTSTSATADGISGWTEYIIVDAAIKCLAKEESDVSVLMAQKQALTVRIQAMSDSRDVGSPHKVGDALAAAAGYQTGAGWGDWWGPY